MTTKDARKERRDAEQAEIAQRALQSEKSFAEIKEALRADLDAKRAEYVEVAQDFEKSYSDDVDKAIGALEDIDDKIASLEGNLAKLRESMGALMMKGEAEQLEAVEAESKEKAAELEQLKERREILKKYRPTGSAPFVTVAAAKDSTWRSSKTAADQIAAGIVKAADERIAELEKIRNAAKHGIWGEVEIRADLSVSALKRKNRGELTAEEALECRRKQNADQEAREEALRLQRERYPELFGEKPAQEAKKPIFKTIYTADRGEVRYQLNERTGEYEEIPEGVNIRQGKGRI